ncbi:hypothetical protein [Acidovorax sp.]|uniref:hypothetical protein n=1 Tax=Acidovorax sp. TaxID=1872122 RepID=UPI00391F0F9B
MSNFPQRVRDNILPLSENEAVADAFNEWVFAEETVDHEQCIEVCQLCEQEDLRYHFLIENELNGNQLWVGSQCILRFEVGVLEQGRKLSPKDAKKKLNRIYQQMRFDACIKALERVVATERNDILTNAWAYYRNHGHLTPKYAFVVLWRLQVNKIDHSPTFFKVTLKTAHHKIHLAEMALSRVHLIWPALTSGQRVIAQRLGHTPPPVQDTVISC